MTNTRRQKKKKTPKNKRKSTRPRSTFIPALVFLLLTAVCLAGLYQIVKNHQKIIPKPHKQFTKKQPTTHSTKQSNKVSEKNQNKHPHNPVVQTQQIICFRLSKNFSQLEKESHKIPAKLSDKQKAGYIIKYLTGHSKYNLPSLPQATKIRSITFHLPQITIDLNDDIRKGLINSGTNDEMLAIASLTNSFLDNYPKYKFFQILINGKKCRTLAGHIDIFRPLSYQVGIDVK